MEPIVFEPQYMTRVWGGRSLEEVFGRELPDEQTYGESWEVSDREGEQSVVKGGLYGGWSLHELWSSKREEVFGAGLEGERFPLLVKILDARDDLSIQVHPPESHAEKLGGEPKTEMWYIVKAEEGAKLYVGLKDGVTQEGFQGALKEGTLQEKVYSLRPKDGESIFIPSGRLHAIGAGFLIFEIQQNSDTTYRVFDWNRVGLDGNPRELHIEESLCSIDFEDFEPKMDVPSGGNLAQCDFFTVDKCEVEVGTKIGNLIPGRFTIFGVVSGGLRSAGGLEFEPGDFFLLPIDGQPLVAKEETVVIRTTVPC